MISKEEVLRIAKLARLELTDQEVGKMQKDLSAILQYFEVLQKVKSSKLKVKSLVENNVMRKDEVMQKPATLAGDLVQGAPDKKDGYVKVKSIL